MRQELKLIYNRRLRFRAVVERFGEKKGYRGYPEPTILFKNVVRTDTGKQVTDHIWFTVGKTISSLGLRPGDTVEFDARVGGYVKGYVNHREYRDDRILDYKLNRPTRFQKVS